MINVNTINGTTMIAVDDGYHIERNGVDLGLLAFVPASSDEIKEEIKNGTCKAVADDGSAVPEEFDYESAYNELVEVIENG